MKSQRMQSAPMWLIVQNYLCDFVCCIFWQLKTTRMQGNKVQSACDRTGICQPSSSLWFFRLFVWMGSTYCLLVLPLGCPVSVGGLLQGLPLTTEELLPRFNVASFYLELLQDVHNTKHRDSVLLVSMYRLSMLVTLASNSAQRRIVPAKTSLYEANFKLL